MKKNLKLTAGVLLVSLALIGCGSAKPTSSTKLQIVVNADSARVLSRSLSSPEYGADTFVMENVSGIVLYGAQLGNEVIFSPADLTPTVGGTVNWLSVSPPPPTFTTIVEVDTYTALHLTLPGNNSLQTVAFTPPGGVEVQVPVIKFTDSTADDQEYFIAYPGDHFNIDYYPVGRGVPIYGDSENVNFDGLVLHGVLPRNLGIEVTEGNTTTVYLSWDFSRFEIVSGPNANGVGTAHLVSTETGEEMTRMEFWDCLTISSTMVPTVPPAAPVITSGTNTTITWNAVPTATSYNVYKKNTTTQALALVQETPMLSYVTGTSGTYVVVALTGTIIGAVSEDIIIE